jgi:hypothetical protein
MCLHSISVLKSHPLTIGETQRGELVTASFSRGGKECPWTCTDVTLTIDLRFSSGTLRFAGFFGQLTKRLHETSNQFWNYKILLPFWTSLHKKMTIRFMEYCVDNSLFCRWTLSCLTSDTCILQTYASSNWLPDEWRQLTQVRSEYFILSDVSQ